jgi:serine/threonine protein kinase
MMRRLKHSNIIELFGYGRMPNGDHFIVMEFMENGSLDAGSLTFCVIKFL